MKKYLDIGKRLKKIRGHKTQGEFAVELGTSLRAYQYFESGDRLPPPPVLAKAARAGHSTIDWLLTGDKRFSSFLTVAATDGLSFPWLDRSIFKELRDKAQTEGFPLPWETEEDFTKWLFDWRPPEYGSLSSGIYLKIFEKLNRIFNEGDQNKIEAIESQLRALDPGEEK